MNMSVCTDSAECPSQNSVPVHSNPACVSETLLKNTNVHSCHVEEDTQSDSELLKGLLTDSFCQVCEAVLMFESQRVSHYEGKKHAQRVRIYLQTKKAEKNKQNHESSSFQSVSTDPEKFCKLCNMVFSSAVVAKSHYEGKVHAKNTRKSSAPVSGDCRISAAPPVAPLVNTVEASAQGDAVKGARECTASAPTGAKLSDPDKYCDLCTALFNNPTMAAEHYSGRKHQRNLARQEPHTNSLTCPLSSLIDTHHMTEDKHDIKEITQQEDVGKKKVYDSFQDELADYIQVQRSRGLDPKTAQGSEPHVPESEAERPIQPHVQLLHPRFPAFPTHPWCSPGLTFRGRFPVPNQWDQGYSPYPPPLIPGLTGRALRKARCPESLGSSSSLSDSSSSYGSTSSSEEHREKRRKKRPEGTKKRREDADYSGEDFHRRRKIGTREDGSMKNLKRQRESSDEDHGKRRKEKRHKEVTKKRRRDEDERNRAKGDGGGLKDEKGKQKKERKKVNDNRTEEEKLWDETILGSF